MERPRVYLAEDVHRAVATGLRRRGFDVLTTAEAGRLAATDEEQLVFAAAQGRVLVTFNRGDFASIHARYVVARQPHAGIVVSRQAAVGRVVRLLSALFGARDPSDFVDCLYWLSISDADAP